MSKLLENYRNSFNVVKVKVKLMSKLLENYKNSFNVVKVKVKDSSLHDDVLRIGLFYSLKKKGKLSRAAGLALALSLKIYSNKKPK